MIDDDPRIDPDDLRSVRFPGSRRRYEAPAVDQFVASLVDRVAATNALVDTLQRELAAAHQAAGGERAPSDESTSPFDRPDLSAMSDDELVGLVGTETAHVLSTARRAAEEIRSKAEDAAARVIREATATAQRTVEDAEAAAAAMRAEAEAALTVALAEAETAATELRAAAADEVEGIEAAIRAQADEAAAAADAVRADAEADAERLRDEARDEGRAMVQEAKAVRTRVLDDLQRRRDIARAQVETLLAGRTRLLAAYERVRADLELATTELEAAGPELDPDDGADGLIEPLLDDAEPAAATTEPAAATTGPADHEPDEAAAPDADPAAGADTETDASALAPADEPSDSPEPPAEVESEVAVVVESEDEDAAASADLVDVDDAGPAGDVDLGDAAATEPAEDVAADAAEEDSEAAEGDGEEEERDVDALFARIRAERAESVARAQRVLSGEAPATAEPVTAEATESESESESESEPEPEPVDVDHVAAELLASGPIHDARAAVVDELDAKLSRALKRHLADEQNEVLDGLRRTQSTDLDQLLPEAAVHIAGYAEVAHRELVAAAVAGASTIDPDAEVDVSELAEKLGAALIEPFRRRIERAADEVEGDADELDERLRAVYREWKVSHIGAATTDALLSAYAQGQLAAAPRGATVRWLIDPEQGPCPDAEDNALAGAVAAGDPFPTGDTCPQAHPGCRCLLVVET